MPVLTPNQKKILSLLAGENIVSDHFYLTGGTALSEFYLHHRLSEDLDFFSEQEVDAQAISALFKKIKDTAGIAKVTFQQSFNRNLFLLELVNDSIKTEFTYFPFPRIEKGQMTGSLAVDSLIDIAVNKLFTIHQKPRSRDFIDLYCILMQQKKWTISGLIEKARAKFDHHIDLLQLGAQFVKAENLKDYPTMLNKVSEKEWQGFFAREAKKLVNSQLG